MRLRPHFLCFLTLLCACGDDAASAEPDAGQDAVTLDSEEARGEDLEPTDPALENEAERSDPEEVVVQIEDGMALVPAGIVHAGSLPGSPDRVARGEADYVDVHVPAFRIDVALFGEGEAMRNITREDAATQCEAAGKRLCNELEWERACEGPGDDRFAGGDSYNANATSVFGVRSMGTIGEWTSSPPLRELAPGAEDGAVFRGAGGDQEDVLRRCDARRGTSGATQSRNLSFRCCQSVEEATEPPSYPDETTRARFRPLSFDDAAIRQIMRRVPALAPYADSFVGTSEESALAALGEPGLAVLNGWELAAPAMSWSPVPGDEIWVFHGVSRGRPILAAVYPLVGDRLLHATTLVLEEGASPFVVAFTPPERGMLRWSTSWGTTAESGVLQIGEDKRIAFEVR